jgi:predicted GIY-YIG superfamily endonuclease
MNEPTITHYVSEKNNISSEEAVKLGLPIQAKCGLVWIPKYAKTPKRLRLPQCQECESAVRRERLPRNHFAVHFVYRHYDEQGVLLYVGCTFDPRTRAAAHKANSWWFDQVATTRLIIFPDREYALQREREAIADEHPLFNIRGRWPHRAMWEPEHYVNYYRALVSDPEAASRRGAHVSKVVAEAKRRYDLDVEAAA